MAPVRAEFPADPGPVAPVRAESPADPRPVAPVRAEEIPDGIRSIARVLRGAGHEAHLVGGCVRDLVRGVAPKDWDVATDARPDRLLALFPGRPLREPLRDGGRGVPRRDL